MVRIHVRTSAQAFTELDKIRLRNYLEDIAASFENMIAQKREIALLLGRKLTDRSEQRLLETAQDLLPAVLRAKQRVEALAGSLVGVYQAKGVEVSQALDDSLTARKLWLGELLARPPGAEISDAERIQYSNDALASAKGFEDAYKELCKLIDYTTASD